MKVEIWVPFRQQPPTPKIGHCWKENGRKKIEIVIDEYGDGEIKQFTQYFLTKKPSRLYGGAGAL